MLVEILGAVAPKLEGSIRLKAELLTIREPYRRRERTRDFNGVYRLNFVTHTSNLLSGRIPDLWILQNATLQLAKECVPFEAEGFVLFGAAWAMVSADEAKRYARRRTKIMTIMEEHPSLLSGFDMGPRVW